MAVGTGTMGPAFYTEAETARYRLSWGSVFAGVVVAMVTFLTLELLGLGVGLGLINPAAEQRFAAVGIGTGIWMVLSTIISLFVGGWVTSWVSGTATPMRGILHGIVMWGLVTLLSFYLMTSAVGSLIGGFAGVIGTGITGMAGVAPQAITQQAGLPGNILNDVQQVLRQSARSGADQQAVIGSLTTLFIRGDAATSADRDRVINALVANTTLSRPVATGLVNNWVAQFSQFRGVAATAGQQVTETLSSAALWAFFAMILGAGAAGFGGWLGAPVRVRVTGRGEIREEPKERKAA
ncbi:MAG: hypothetical protein HY954_11270 [Deltaproteobacteria bacterium]|nr:hypothetical protein [Deltaproteobacteria bacterium]